MLDRLVEGAGTHLRPGGLLALEVGDGQAETVAGHIRAAAELGRVAVKRDLAGRARFVLARKPD